MRNVLRMSTASATLLSILSLISQSYLDSVTVIGFSREDVFDLLHSTEIITGVGFDSLPLAFLRCGAVTLSDAFTSQPREVNNDLSSQVIWAPTECLTLHAIFSEFRVLFCRSITIIRGRYFPSDIMTLAVNPFKLEVLIGCDIDCFASYRKNDGMISLPIISSRRLYQLVK